jgi:uncharacterized protein (TIGR00299 family) protein
VTKTIYFDCPTGLAGDMILAALLDCGADLDYIKEHLLRLQLPPWQISCQETIKNQLAAKKLQISYEKSPQHRHLADIEQLIMAANFPATAEKTALAIFNKLAQAEAAVHGTSTAKVHFHEVGATDALIDICGSALALDFLGIEKVYSSPLPLSHGFVTCDHGTIAIPAPAVLELLKGAKLRHSMLNGELITPTGAAILMTIIADDGFFVPDFVLQTTGRGAGKRDLPVANILRLHLGSTTKKEAVDVLTCWIDDSQPEFLGYLWEKMLENDSVLDMGYSPLFMKKGRPAWQLSVITMAGSAEEIAQLIMAETSTLGVRIRRERRLIAPRYSTTVKTPYGTIAIKVSKKGASVNVSPEFSSCQKAAQQTAQPLKAVYQAAIAAYLQQKT